jgi:hypothetical protein
LRSSRLLWVLREALSLVERETGAIVRLGEDDATWPVSSSVPQADWFVDLPEIPAWAAMASAYGATAPDTVSLWLSLAPSPPSLSAAAALRTRAYLAHALVAMASQWSTLDWSAHLWSAPKPSVGADPTAALPVDFANGGESAIGEVTARGEPSAGPGTSVPSRETLILKQGGTTPWMEPGSVVGDRQWRQDDVLLTVLAVDLGGSRAHAIVRDFPVRRSEDEDSTTLVVTRPAESLVPVWVEAALVAPKRAVVEILVPLLGDKDRDLDRLARVRAVLGDYKGEAQVRLVLTRGNFRRVLDGEDGYGIAWSGSFVDALELLLGIGCARLIE